MKNREKIRLLEAPGLIISGLTILLFMIFMASLASAFLNSAGSISLKKGGTLQLGAVSLPYNQLWDTYAPIHINSWLGLGSEQEAMALDEHTSTCGTDCYSTMNIHLDSDGPLIDSVKFYTVQDDGSEVEQSIRNYQFYIENGTIDTEVPDYEQQCQDMLDVNGSTYQDCQQVQAGTHTESEPIWIPYSLGDTVPAGDYYLKLEGQKRPDRVVDWKITAQGQEISDWSVWGIENNFYYQHGVVLDQLTGALTEPIGWKIYTGPNNFSITAVNKVSGATFTEVKIEASCGGTALGTATYVGNKATFPSEVVLAANSTYFIESDNYGSSFVLYYSNVGTYPKAIINDTLTGYNFTMQTRTGSDGETYCADYTTNFGAGIISLQLNVPGGVSNVVLTNPANNTYTNTTGVRFNSTTTIFGGATITSRKLYDNASGTWQADVSLAYPPGGSQTWNDSYFYTFPDWKTFIWAVQACDTDLVCGFSENRTITTDAAPPTINLLYPTGIIPTANYGQNITLNYSIVSPFINACWYNYNITTNVTIPCNANSTFALGSYGMNNLTLYANNSLGNLGSSYAQWGYTYFINNETYNPVTYETSLETYILNAIGITGATSATLVYNGTSYPATVSYEIANVTIDMPLTSGISQKNFYWNLDGINTEVRQQNFSSISFAICQAAPLDVPFLNINYRDEITNNAINATIINSIWNYAISPSSAYSKQLIYNNLSDTELQHSFCFSPSDRPITVSSATYQYGNVAAGYSTKTWPFRNLLLTNSSSAYTLYLIALTDSGTSPITLQAVSSQTNAPVPNVRISVYKSINGALTMVDDGYTDASGAIAYYMSPVTSYTIVTSGGGCSSFSSTITPTSNQYNLLLNCGGGTASQKFVSSIDGISYQRTPADGLGIPGSIQYAYYITSNITAMTRVRFELLDATTSTLLASNDSLTDGTGVSGCIGTSCLLTIQYTTYTGDNLKGRYYVAVNGTGNSSLVLLEGDAYWRYIIINENNSANAFNRLMLNLQDFFSTWGINSGANENCMKHSTETTCNSDSACKWINQTAWATNNPYPSSTFNSICIPNDEVNKAEFNRVITIFFGLVIILFILGKTTGYELNHPGSFVLAMSAVIWILSFYGMFTFSGLTNVLLFGDFFNKYIFALSTSCASVGYFISIIRRYS